MTHPESFNPRETTKNKEAPQDQILLQNVDVLFASVPVGIEKNTPPTKEDDENNTESEEGKKVRDDNDNGNDKQPTFNAWKHNVA